MLAHCGLTDLAWIWQDLDDTPNLYFDTSWWGASHVMALFALVPPGRILHGSDLPYATLLCAVEPMQRGEGPGTMLSVAQHATKVPCDHPDEPVVASVARLLELYEQHPERLPRRNQFAPGWDLIMAAATVARTPVAGP